MKNQNYEVPCSSTLVVIRIHYMKQMKVVEVNTTIVDGYVGLLDNLSTSNKLDLITKLTASVKTDLSSKKSSLKKPLAHLIQKNLLKKLLKKSVRAELQPDSERIGRHER